MEEILDFVKTYKKVCILGFLTLVVLIVCVSFNGGQARRLRDIQAQTSQLQSNLKVLEQKSKEKNEATVLPSGLNTSRFESDREAMDAFLKEILTFDSYEEYNEIRLKLISDYGFNPSEEFLRIFYQETTDEAETPDRYQYLKLADGNYQLSMEKFTPYIIRIDNGEYTYLCDVTAKSQDKTYRFGIVCAVNEDKTVSFAQGYALMPEE